MESFVQRNGGSLDARGAQCCDCLFNVRIGCALAGRCVTIGNVEHALLFAAVFEHFVCVSYRPVCWRPVCKQTTTLDKARKKKRLNLSDLEAEPAVCPASPPLTYHIATSYDGQRQQEDGRSEGAASVCVPVARVAGLYFCLRPHAIHARPSSPAVSVFLYRQRN